MKTLLSIGLSLPIIFPSLVAGIYDREVFSRSGYTTEGYVASVDSIVDLSDLPGYGIPMEWKCGRSADGTTVQSFGDRWVRYEISGDTLFLTHRENARERSDFRIPLMAGVAEDVARGYMARSRRDMSFAFTDSGTYTVRRFVTPALILADGDTVLNCPGEERVFKYVRSKGKNEAAPVGTVCDTETLWGPYTATGPLAASFSRHIHTGKVEGMTECKVFSFPREINGDGRTDGFRQTDSLGNYGRSRASRLENEPDIDLYDREIKISSLQKFDYTLCDISGRVVRTGKSLNGTITVGLKGLPAGEYIVNAYWDSGQKSRTLLVK